MMMAAVVVAAMMVVMDCTQLCYKTIAIIIIKFAVAQK